MGTPARTAAIPLALLMALGTAACDSGEPLETAKAEICESAPGWEATLQAVSTGEGGGTLQTEVSELASGVDDATVALEEAGAENIAEASQSFGDRLNEMAAALESGSAEAAQMATDALTRLDALTTLAECD